MNTSDQFAGISEERLNSLIDGQLVDEERQEILAALENNKDLADRVCELQRVKQMTRLAYETIPAPYPHEMPPQHHWWSRAVAAVAVFALGLMLGLSDLRNLIVPESAWQQAETRTTTSTRVLVHLTSSNSEAGLSTLTNLEQMLQNYRASGEQVQVEVIANGHGINLLRQGTTPFGELIARLSDEYDNLSFAACKSTIDQIQITEGSEIELIPEARLIDSGVVEVIERQKQGWTYIRG
jgi:hypothetical protein